MTSIRGFMRRLLGKGAGKQFDYDPMVKLTDVNSSFAGIASAQHKAKVELEESYRVYKRDVSPGSSAASLQFASLLMAMLRLTRPKRIIDLGSGYTSFVLRKYKNEMDFSVHVVSVDSSREWLSVTEEYLLKNGLDAQHLFDWESFSSLNDFAYDLVVLDIRPITRRVESLPKLIKGLSPGGLVLVDDVHKPHMAQPMLELVAMNSWLCVSLESLTLDDYGRFAAIVTYGDD